MKDKTTAAILAFFLGGIGVHRFYLGQTGLGILYLIFVWTFVPAFIALIYCILLLIMNKAAFDRKYNVAPSVTVNVNRSAADELEKLHQLKNSGAITPEEYERHKSKIM